MKHYKVDALLCEPELGVYQLFFKGAGYKPSDNPTAVGVLLFGLRPRGIKFKCIGNPEGFMFAAQQAAHILHMHANGDKMTLDGKRRVPQVDLVRWVNEAVALAPDEETANAARLLINENMGPYAYDD